MVYGKEGLGQRTPVYMPALPGRPLQAVAQLLDWPACRSSKSFLWNRAVCIYDTVSTSDICGQDIAKVLWVRGNVMVDPMEVRIASRKPTLMTGHLPLPAIAFCCVLWPGA